MVKVKSECIFFNTFTPMQGATPRKSLLFQLSLLSLYVLFFAVQLHFRYSTLSDNAGSTPVFSGSSANKTARISVDNTGDDTDKSNIRLNKRYFPGHGLLFTAAQLPVKEEFVIVLHYRQTVVPSLSSSYPGSKRQRGPPSAC